MISTYISLTIANAHIKMMGKSGGGGGGGGGGRGWGEMLMGWHGHACFDDLVNFSLADSFDLQEIFSGRVNNRFNSAETRIFKLLNIN
jgi:hypothetical protein